MRGIESTLRTFLLIIAALLCLYTISFSGVFRVDDEHILAARAQSLALWGELSDPQVYGNQRVQALIPLGDQATQIEPAQTLLGAGLYRLATTLGFGGAQALFSLNIYLTAFTAGVVFLTVLSLDYQQKIAIWCAIIFGVGSMAWPYATTYYRDTLAMMMSSIAFLGWAWMTEGSRRLRVAGCVLTVGGLIGGMLAKNTVAALIPAFAIAGGILWFKSHRSGKQRIKALVITIGVVVAVYVIIASLPEQGPLARYSLDYYRFLAGHFVSNLDVGFLAAVLGPFLSPAKSLLLFSPPLLITIAGMRKSWKSNQSFTLAALLFSAFLAVAQALFYRERWAGTFGWGLRFMLPALPALFALLAAGLDSLSRGIAVLGRVMVWIILLFSALVQMSGAFVDWRLVYQQWQSRGSDPYTSTAAWDARLLAIPGHLLRLLRPHEWSVAWARLSQTGLYRACVVPFLAIVFGVFIMWMLHKHQIHDPQSRRRRALFVLVIVLAFSLPIIPTWWGIRADPYWGAGQNELEAALMTIEQNSLQDDVIIIDSYGTILWDYWINHWSQPQRWYSLPFEIPGSSKGAEVLPPSVETLTLFESLQETAERLWYVTSDAAPDFALEREVQWLENQFVLVESHMFMGKNRVELYLFKQGEK